MFQFEVENGDLCEEPPRFAREAGDAAMLNNAGTTKIHVTVPAGAPIGSHPSIFLLSQHTADDATMWPLSLDVE